VIVLGFVFSWLLETVCRRLLGLRRLPVNPDEAVQHGTQRLVRLAANTGQKPGAADVPCENADKDVGIVIEGFELDPESCSSCQAQIRGSFSASRRSQTGASSGQDIRVASVSPFGHHGNGDPDTNRWSTRLWNGSHGTAPHSESTAPHTEIRHTEIRFLG
jgi:hypothetical protein